MTPPFIADLHAWHPEFNGVDLWLADDNRPLLQGPGFAVGGVPYGDSLFVRANDNLWKTPATSDLEFAYCPPNSKETLGLTVIGHARSKTS